MKPSEFFSIIPQKVRKHLWVTDHLSVIDAIEMIKLQAEVDMSSDYVQTIKDYVLKEFDVTLDI